MSGARKSIPRAVTSSSLRPFFVFVLIALSPIAFAFGSNLLDVQTVTSTADGVRFKVACRADLSDLRILTSSDSTPVLAKTVQVGIPYGATVRLTDTQWRLLQTATSDSSTTRIARQSGSPRVLISKPITIRGRQVVSVQINPVVDGAVYGEVEIALTFVGGTRAGEGVPASDPVFNRIFRAALVNYDQFAMWPQPARAAAKVAVAEGPFTQATTWYKMAVNQTGLCKVTGAQLQAAGLSLTNLHSDSIRIFNDGGLPLEMDNAKPRPAFSEIALDVQDGGDGLFGANDQILFYGESPNRWVYSSGTAPRYVSNPYTPTNVYWLAVSGSFAGPAHRMAHIDGTPSGSVDTTITTATQRVHVEQNNMLLQDNTGHIDNYYTWYWSDSTRLQVFANTPGAISGAAAQLYLDGRTGGMSANVNGIFASNGNCNSYFCTYTTRTLVDGLNNIQLYLTTTSSWAPYFHFLELAYPSNLLPANDRLDVVLDSSSKRAQMQIQDNYSATPVILNLADPLQPSYVDGATRSGGVMTFDASLSSSSVNRFYAATPATASTPVTITQTSPADLRAA
ncbi:MAG TPA: hypothetical protein VMS71_05875, partial [Candidatus Acidoferrum sp.]|nr:hypothetical protein [Candidatus Acidoferrum sp.]